MTNYNHASENGLDSRNNGWAAEHFAAIVNGYRRDGRPGKTDLFDGSRRIEVKFFTIKPATFKKNAEYNSAHGFKANKTEPLLDQLKRYCQKFDALLVGAGEDVQSAEYQLMTRKEAYDFLSKRLSYKAGSDEVRFCWGGKSLESRLEGRMNTLRKHGYII